MVPHSKDVGVLVSVIPAQAGIHASERIMDPRFRGDDDG